MNDNERDRSGDGAGPHESTAELTNRHITVAHILYHTQKCILCSIALLHVFFFVSTANIKAQTTAGGQLRGLSLLVDVGTFVPHNSHANFYNGNPNNVNTLYRILHSETYGNQIWNNLTERDMIGSSIANYRQLTVAEYGDMYYKLAFQLGMGFRYDLDNNRWAWSIQFDYARLHATGAVLINSGHNMAYLSNQNEYVVCPLQGAEERIYVDLALIRKFKTANGIDIELAAGANVNNTKVESSDISIGNITYSILDVWGGQSPSSYTASYDYINQGGIGYGSFATVGFGYTLPVGTAIGLYYTFHYNKVNLEGYSSFAPHHAVKLTVALNNFSIF